MSRFVCPGLALAILWGVPAQARHVWYFGARADAFIARHLRGAVIPGDVNRAFAWGPHGRRHGWASCHVPAMGERSGGIVSRCYVKF